MEQGGVIGLLTLALALGVVSPALANSEAVLNTLVVPLVAFLIGGGVVLLYFLFSASDDDALAVEEQKRRNAVLLATLNSAFYYQNLESGREWFSQRLRNLLGLPGKNLKLPALESILEESDFEKLRQGVIDLKAGVEEFSHEFHLRDGRVMECFGTLQEHDGIRHLVLWWQDVSERMKRCTRLETENERLKRELQILNNLVNTLPMPIWQRDKNLQIRWCNLAYMEATNDIESSDDDETLELDGKSVHLARRAITSQSVEKERRHVILHGERRYFDFTEIPWSDKQHLTGVGVDMTELEMVKEELSRTLSAQSDLLESTTSAIAIYGPDQKLKFFNNAFVALWKLEESWLSTQPRYADILEKLRENRSLPEQANFPLYKQQHLRMFTDLLEPEEEFLYLPDGRTLRVLAIPHTLGGILLAYENVTDKLALERSYNTLIAVQKETLDNLHEGVAVFGEDGRLKLFNPVFLRIWKLDRETASTEPHIGDLLDRSKNLLFYEDWQPFKQQFLAELHRREVTLQRLERKDGRVYDVITVPLPDGQTLLNYVDMTDSILVERSLRDKNEALEEADRLKSEFLANVSYELRSPLTSISGFAEMLQLEYLGALTDPQKDYIGSIQEASQQLMHLINDILDIASIEAGYLHLEIYHFNVCKMLHTVVSLVGERARRRNISIRVDCHPKLGDIMADENRIRQVIFNLATNAIKYCGRDEGKVVLGAEPHIGPDGEDEVRIWVTDNGVGIPLEEQEQVFNKFYRGAAARKRSGTGLGLSMVKSFIEMHGGRVDLHSVPGEGTTVTCYLPRECKPQTVETLPTENTSA